MQAKDLLSFEMFRLTGINDPPPKKTNLSTYYSTLLAVACVCQTLPAKTIPCVRAFDTKNKQMDLTRRSEQMLMIDD